MNIKKIFKKICISCCVIFTFITAIYMLILQIINISNVSASVEASRVLLFFVFSVLLALANTILSLKQLHSIARYMLHYLILILGFWTCFCLPNGMNASTVFVGIIFVTIGYSIVMPIIALFKRRLAKNNSEPERYEKQFSKKKK